MKKERNICNKCKQDQNMDDSIEEQDEETILGKKITLVSEVLMYTNH